MVRRKGLVAACIALVALVLLFQGASVYFSTQEQSKAAGRLSLYRSTVIAELERFSHLPYVLARDPFVQATAEGGDRGALNIRLRGFAAQSGVDAIYLMTTQGETISASNAGTSLSFVGHNYAFRPYVRDALEGRQGRFYGIGTTTGLPGYFISEPVRDAAGRVIGVIAIKLDLTDLEAAWRDGGEQVLLANDEGVVLLASDEAWRYRLLRELSEAERARIERDRQFSGADLRPLDWEQRGERSARIGGVDVVHMASSDLPHGWSLHYFASRERIVTLSWLVTALALGVAAVAVILYQLKRTERIGAALRRSEAEEAELRLANERLAVEIEERRAAERRLQRTQKELERASRLAALGELSASVTHELGQPIAALKNHIAAAEISGRSDPALLAHLSGLTERIEGLTRQLRFFARPGQRGLEPVDLDVAMDEALALVAPNLERAHVTLSRRRADPPVVVQGSKLRIEQVMTNLLRNAIDAMEEESAAQLDVSVGTEQEGEGAAIGWFEVRDTGHGLGAATLDELQEPFVTRRASGEGMGLGLAISASIVREHGGRLVAQNADETKDGAGGAVFRVELPLVGDDGEDKI
ncbi:sensor histidine kinase [Celeribacter halophilus]|uniref:histidine kinase n=1 Tax=Celeribacter halophilus TaxID=576117 RepID=A0A1I3MMK2_9RHOB|nr:ATP-binding protein [Celeribacter halophilus]PZX15436.1 two-component system C4-dicarboxylate transport sensor histidine kinase DctB [Celeribacter halophilus]SFI98030.1 two-component system, NtrC family, C4-dicarboxylate transport sensor histidine kinase DctB [Celeribacter halophilus]